MSKGFAILLLVVGAVLMFTCGLADFSSAGPPLPIAHHGRVVVFQSSSMRCALYVNESGTTHGTAAISCVDLPYDEAIDNSIRILDVSPTVKSKD